MKQESRTESRPRSVLGTVGDRPPLKATIRGSGE